MAWRQPNENGLRLHLTDEEILSLHPFYERCGKDLLTRAAAAFLDEIPQEEIEARYPRMNRIRPDSVCSVCW